ncbi:MAG: ABC transporter permease subunit [Fimbriimonadaceae bacterium]|nr:ABC transporter permease subunit [Fimbriimonadaceae bacterium]
MNTWQALVADNPLLKLVMASSVRIFTRTGLRTTKTAIWFVGVLVLCVTLLAGYFAEYLFWQIFLIPLLLMVILIPLAVLHGSIAGEREKRSIEVLLVAPLTSAQILFAKVSKGVLPVAVTIALFIPVALAIEIGHIWKPMLSPVRSVLPSWQTFLLAMAVVASSAMFSAGLTMFVSARAKTTGAALIGSLFALLAWLVGLPILDVSISGFGARPDSQLELYHTNPFWVVGSLISGQGASPSEPIRDSIALSLALVVFSILLLVVSRGKVREFWGKRDA